MRRDYHNGHSQSLNRDMELVAYGHAGVPLLVFPTLGGRFYEYEDQGMIQTISSKIENGELNVFCVDSVDKESWQNVEIHAYQRVMRHFAYEAYILNDVLPLIRATASPSPLSVTGCGFGGYHAFNLAMKHPDLVARCVSMSGSFNIKPFVDTYYDNNVYFNNPVDYLPNLSDRWFLDRYANMRIVLAAGDHDSSLGENYQIAAILGSKGIPHSLDIWTESQSSDWPVWQQMAVKFF